MVYAPSLTPRPSPLRPHVLAKEHLHEWLPLNPSPTPLAGPTEADPHSTSSLDMNKLLQIKALRERAWDESTLTTYGSGLLVFHVFCDSKDIAEADRAPASHTLIISFIASLARCYSGSTITNYVSGIRAWHLLHSLKWQVDKLDLDILIRAADKSAPPTSKHPPCEPFTINYIISLRQHLALDNPLHAAVFACLTMAFYGTAHLGELTVPTLNSFDPTKHIKPLDVRTETDRHGLISTVFHIPKTKTAKVSGKDIYWAQQEGPLDPLAAYNNHLQVNEPTHADHLFSYLHKGKHRPLTKQAFIKTLTQATQAARVPALKGHAICIGSTLEYLLHGVPLEAMKAKGHWASDAFSVYLTHHAQVLAPYIQAQLELHMAFLQLTIPSPRNCR
ncbi:hypothetical protein D9756_010246 [Leucocoprinus leucothites]|uniref:Core-binding (CB) domain-containing protein n=1 Tax=Leucocoprinus leucothites TaxID=201217 RepID=A0A8H5FSQ4_9AGAR|nr:hypothetical protein D9756_010246 [Leucoagaricus leucothites]